MALKNLSTETMILISAAWTDPARDRRVLEGIGIVQELLPAVDAAHADALATRRVIAPDAAALGRMVAEAEAMDQRHDSKARGIYWVLTGLAELAESPAEAQALLDLRDRLLPSGLATATLSYTAEAGNAEALRARLDGLTRVALARIPTHGGRTLADEVDAWLQAGGALGRLEAERARLARLAGDEGGGRADQRARGAWIRAANALVSTLELVEVGDATRERVLGPLREAEAKADRRAGKSTFEPDPGR